MSQRLILEEQEKDKSNEMLSLMHFGRAQMYCLAMYAAKTYIVSNTWLAIDVAGFNPEANTDQENHDGLTAACMAVAIQCPILRKGCTYPRLSDAERPPLLAKPDSGWQD